MAAEDAKTIAATASDLTAEDLQSLPAHHAYASLVADGEVTPFASVRTLPPPDTISDPHQVRTHSRDAYGRDLAEIEAALSDLVDGTTGADEPGPGRRRRR